MSNGDAGPEPVYLEEPVLQPDAPLEVKEGSVAGAGALPSSEATSEDRSPRLSKFLLPPTRVPSAAVGARAPRRAADVAGAAFAGARHNWIPTGPRNVGGRVRALAIHPTDPRRMFAGSASGGVHRSVDGGETWVPLWHDQPSLAIGAIGICRDTPNTIYVATGEVRTGGAEVIPGDGIYVSTDGGDNWANPAATHVPGTAPNLGLAFDAIAVHPTNDRHCWAVGAAGIFRTTDRGANWTQFAAGVYYSDVVFSFIGAAPCVYLVRGVSTAGEATIIRIDAPEAADANITADLANAANATTVIAAPAPVVPPPDAVPHQPARGKLAVAPSNRDVAYVRFMDNYDSDLGVFRSQNARNVPVSGVAWTGLQRSNDWLDPRQQGSYNLSIAVSPANENHVATATIDLYVALNANGAAGAVAFNRVMAWDLYHVDRGHHADHHQAIFANLPGAPAGALPALWVSNDGGISVSTNWNGAAHRPLVIQPLAPNPPLIFGPSSSLPVPAGSVAWRKRSHGISATQMYDLTQSPLLPTMYGCGFQDNGVFITTGGPSWRLVLGADGGFVTFDPDDPYRSLVTWQGGITEAMFPGRLEGTLPAPGDPITDGLWARVLASGFLTGDGAAFVADSALHPRKAGRALNARMNRLYGTRAQTAERWSPEPVGRAFDIVFTGGGTIEVLPSTAAQPLGLVPQVNDLSVQSSRPGPYRLQEGDALRLILGGPGPPAPPQTVINFRRNFEIPDLGNASAAEVAHYIRAECARLGVANVESRACFWATPLSVEVTTEDVGAAAQITLGGSALVVGAGALSRLGLNAGAYRGSAGQPASVTLAFPGLTSVDWGRNRDLRRVGPGAPLQLSIQIGAGPARAVEFSAPTFADPGAIAAGELAEAIRAALGADRARVVARTVTKSVRLTDLGGNGVQVAGTAATRLNLSLGGAFGWMQAGNQSFRDGHLNQNVGNFNSFDLAPPVAGALTLTISDTVNVTPALTFNAATAAANNIADLRCVTTEELQRTLAAHIAATPAVAANVRCDLVFRVDQGQPNEIVYAAADPEVVWVGAEDGTVYRSRNDGGLWMEAGDARMRLRDRPVEAIAIHPRDTRTVFVGLAGPAGVAGDSGFLFRTRDAGDNWDHVGADIRDATGALLGINALEIDTGNPLVVFAATDSGVFRSTDGGDHWQPFNEGMPNAIVRDLAFAADTRTLRAGVWGRGTFERHVGERPPRDVQLYVRAGELDDGSVRPFSRGPAGYALSPRHAPPAESPDIKVNRDRPPLVGADELVDGVEFDEDIAHDEPTPLASNLFVQVHNRGAFPAAAVRIVALWAPAPAGPPRLPEDFWARFAAPPLTGGLVGWNLIGDHTFPAATQIRPGYPRVHTFPVAWPPDIGTHRRIGILVLVSAPDDTLPVGERDVATLLARDPKVAYRETATRTAADDDRLFLKQTGSVQFSIANPPGPATSAAPQLGLAVGGPVGELRGNAAPFNLGAGAPQSIVVSTPVQQIRVQLPAVDFNNLAAATAAEVAAVLNRAFVSAGFPARCDDVVVPPAPPPTNRAIRVRGVGETQLTILAPGAPATDAAPNLGLAGGPAQAIQGGTAPYVLNAGAPQTLVISAAPQVTISFPAADVANVAAVTGREARRILNRGLAAAVFPVRAIVPRVELWVRRSVTDVDGRPVTPPARALADLVVEPAAVAAGPARTALFDLLRAHGADRLQANANNFLYLRSANLGVAPQVDARHRLFHLPVGAPPFVPAAIGGPVAQTVPAGGSAVVEFQWNPGALAADDVVFVLAVVDHDPDRPLVVPPQFGSLDELDVFCTANPNAAYRTFEVTP